MQFARTTEEKRMRRIFKIVMFLVVMGVGFPLGGFSQINTDRVLSIGRNALYFEDYVLSIQYFNQVIRVKPYLPEPYFFRAVAKISLEDFKGAEEDCSAALERNPFLVEAYRCRGIARIYQKKFDEAKADFDKGLEFSPENKLLLICKGYVSIQQEDYKQAVKDFTVAVENNPRYKDAYLNRGYAYMSDEDTTSAMQDFQKVLDIDPFSSDGHAARGYVYYAKGEYKQALADFDEAIRLDPYRTGYYINRGLVRYQLNNLRGSMDDYDHVIRLDPYNTMAYYNRGILRTEIGDKNRAVEDFDRVIEMEPDNYFAIYNRALLQSELGALNKSINDFTTIIEKYPDFFPAYYGRGEAKMKKYDKVGAEKDYNTAMLLRQRKLTKKDIDKDSSATRKQSDKNLQHHNKLVVADREEENRRLSYKSESRGRVQNVNFNIDPEKNIVLTFHPSKKSDVKKSIYFDPLIDKLNQSGVMGKKLYLTNSELSFDNQLESIFKEIEEETNIIKEKPSAANYFRRALLFEYISDYDSAIEDLGRAIALSSSSDAWIYSFSRGNCWMKKVEYEMSLEDDVAKNERKNATQYYDEKMNYDLMLKDYEETSKLNPKFPFSWFNRGNVFCAQKDYRNAIANYTKAIELEHNFAEAYFNRGLCYVLIGENAKGISDLSKAGELGIYVAYNVIKRFRE